MRSEFADLDYRAGAARVCRLALGHSAEARSAREWRFLLEVAQRERCGALTWSRSGDSIRASAPHEVVGSWRASWLRSADRVEYCLSELTPVARRLSGRGVVPTWLKGAALSQRLYGDPAARESLDVDWFVPSDQRAVVEEELRDEGWRTVEGGIRGEQAFMIDTPRGRVFLEVHSTLLHERLGLNLPSPPGSPTELMGERLNAFLNEPLLALYLAVHLAGHRNPPLLWWIDVFTLLDNPAYVEHAERLAADFGLANYLAWARAGCGSIRKLVAGDLSAARALGISRTGRIDVHPSIRHVRLAPDLPRALAAAKGWLLPSWAAEGSRWPVATVLRRIARYGPQLFRATPRTGGRSHSPRQPDRRRA